MRNVTAAKQGRRQANEQVMQIFVDFYGLPGSLTAEMSTNAWIFFKLIDFAGLATPCTSKGVAFGVGGSLKGGVGKPAQVNTCALFVLCPWAVQLCVVCCLCGAASVRRQL